MFSAKLHRNLMYFNADLMAQAGYDPAAKPLTWDEFRDAAKKITEAGGYGFANAGGPGANFVNYPRRDRRRAWWRVQLADR